MDDVTFIGPSDGHAAGIAGVTLRKGCEKLGLQWRGNKSKVINLSGSELHAELKKYARDQGMDIVEDAVKLLGTHGN